MGRTFKAALDTKYKSILSRERSWANSVAMAVIKPRPMTVWEVMIPLLFIFNHARLRKDREIFTQNFLFTKELALKAALDMTKSGRSRGAVMSPIEEKTQSILASDEKGIYSEEIRQRQIREIDLLIDHYCKLLQVEGKDYASLVMNAYQCRENYLALLGQLKGAEREVNLAAMRTLGAKGDAEIVSRMEEAVDRVRMATAKKIFGTSD